MTKAELIEIINNIPSDNFDVQRELTKQAETWDLPDIRTGAIYPPYGHSIRRASSPETIRISITCDLDIQY